MNSHIGGPSSPRVAAAAIELEIGVDAARGRAHLGDWGWVRDLSTLWARHATRRDGLALRERGGQVPAAVRAALVPGAGFA